jgi:acyl-coenzyme A thioesterase PaaI-like protein
MTTELLRPAAIGERYALRGEVVRLTRQIAFAEATLTNAEDKLVSRSSGTFLIQRDEAAS